MNEDNPGSQSDMETPAEHNEPLSGETVTISGPELEAAVERVMRRLGAQTRSEGGSALPNGAASSAYGTPPITETPPVTSIPKTSAVSSGASTDIKILYLRMQYLCRIFWGYSREWL